MLKLCIFQDGQEVSARETLCSLAPSYRIGAVMVLASIRLIYSACSGNGANLRFDWIRFIRKFWVTCRAQKYQEQEIKRMPLARLLVTTNDSCREDGWKGGIRLLFLDSVSSRHPGCRESLLIAHLQSLKPLLRSTRQ